MSYVQLVNDSFPGADANPIGGIYTTLVNAAAMQRLSHVAQSTFGIALNGVVDDTNTYSNDQFSSITVAVLGSTGPSDAVDVYVRVNNSTAALIRWRIVQGTTGTTLLWFTNGSTSGSIATPALLTNAPVSGDVFELDAVGQIYTLWHTPVSTGIRYEVGAYTDGGTHVAAGNAAFAILIETGTLAHTTIGNFTAGNIVANARPVTFVVT